MATAVAGLNLALAWLGERHYRRLPQLPPQPPAGPLPALSIIVPARDEAHNLPPLLHSLQAVCYDGPLEIIVVDDGSCDDTAAIARRHGCGPVSRPGSGWVRTTVDVRSL